MAREQLAPYNAVATFPDMESAREVIAALEQAGIEGGDISLLGRAAQEAAADPNTQSRDAGPAKDVTTAAVTGAAVGTGAGAIAGLVGGALAFGIPGVGPVLGSAIWASVLGGAGVGSAIGGLVGGTAATQDSPDWETTYNESVRSGRVLVGVHSDSRETVDRAAEILNAKQPAKLDLFDADRRPLP